MRREQDVAGIVSQSKYASMVSTALGFYKASVLEILRFKPHVIHVNQGYDILPLVRLFAPKTPIVMQYHGEEIRGRSMIHLETELADRITVSTQDLTQYGELLDRPVSSEFTYKGGREPNTAVMLYANYFPKDLRDFAREWCESNGVRLTILNRHTDPLIPFEQMPVFLSKFEYFLDLKGIPEALSKAALEALNCGCKILHDSNTTAVLTDYDFTTPRDYLEFYESLDTPSYLMVFKRIPRLLTLLLKQLIIKIYL